jgi:hypothetical protein
MTKKGEQSAARVEFGEDGTVTKVEVDKVKPQRNDNPAPPVEAGPSDRGTNPPTPAVDEHRDHAHALTAASPATSPAVGVATGAATVVLGLAGLGAVGSRALRRRDR